MIARHMEAKALDGLASAPAGRTVQGAPWIAITEAAGSAAA